LVTCADDEAVGAGTTLDADAVAVGSAWMIGRGGSQAAAGQAVMIASRARTTRGFTSHTVCELRSLLH
jgi:hypothetical protein